MSWLAKSMLNCAQIDLANEVGLLSAVAHSNLSGALH